MTIRKAKEKDIPRLLDLLSQVLEIHAQIRPDIFVSGTTKYNQTELQKLLELEDYFIYVCANELDNVIAYIFCELRKTRNLNFMVPAKTLFIEDFCVDEACRGQHIGTTLFDFVKAEAKRLGCNDICLNVWENNTLAKKFYDAMGFKPKSSQMEYILDKDN
ncbi:MAG: GNAT family N-acetyltransferase [Erysipelotrichaceae bacterium]|jgi:ribosomal protein S18 acetylase RimI-like enzyme|nr:GNAT family N-acetyltransferase [Erysipelotrichaceae bacterium]